jgi:methylated-DNA-protein-cysteine methyltransferase-like protein
MSSAFAESVYRLVRKCPRGKVVSYGGIAALLGKPRRARAVGAALRDLPAGSKVPWWRVVNSSGAISSRPNHGPAIQRKLLEREGVKFSRAGRIDWEKYGWETGESETG